MITALGVDGKRRTYAGKTSKEINWAIGHSGNINLEAGVTYSIFDSLQFPSDTILDGHGAILKLAKGLTVWGGRTASVSQKKAMLMIRGNDAENVTIRNVTIDGSQSDYYPSVRLGTSCYNMATMIGCDGLTIENCTFKNGCNDALLLSACKNVDIDKITVNRCGHDGIYSFQNSNVNVTNSIFINRTNCSCRFDGLSIGSFVNNKCSTSGGGGSGLQFQGTVKNVTVDSNYFRGLPYPGIWQYSGTLVNVLIKNNIVERCKSPGISVRGATLKNNTIR